MTIGYRHDGLVLRVEDVSLTLGGKPILDSISFDVHDIVREAAASTGQIIALLGPSGSGKTRLMRIVAGLDNPTTGRVLIGKDQRPVRRGEVGFVFQSSPLFPHRTVMSNLLAAGAAPAKAAGLLERFGLKDRAGVYPAQLSGGQRQRAAILQQLACSEHFVCLDEPFSGLDPAATDAVCAFLREVADADTINTLILVTHDVSAAVAVADTLLLLGRAPAGARIFRHYDLAAMGLAWRPNVLATSEAAELVREIKAGFAAL